VTSQGVSVLSSRSDTEVLENRELDEVPKELISNVEIDEKENQSPDQTDNQQVIQRFRIYSDAETEFGLVTDSLFHLFLR
jgi:hypothetical protein